MKRKVKIICFNLGFVNLWTPQIPDSSPRFPCQEKWVPLNEKQINDWQMGHLGCSAIMKEGAGPQCAGSTWPGSF